MANPIIPQPDDEAALVEYLLAVPAVAEIVGTRVMTEMANQPTYPLLLVQRIGGLIIWPALAYPALQVDAVGGTKAQCKDLILATQAAILAIANDVVSGAVLASATEEVGPSWLPDTVPVPPIPRYTARYRVLLHN